MKHYQLLKDAFEQGYVLKDGSLYTRGGRKLGKHVSQSGYEYVSITVDKVSKLVRFHHVVWVWHKGKDTKELNHIDGNKRNNTVSNLQVSDRSHNILHAIKLGLLKYPETMPWQVLTLRDLPEIRRLRGLGYTQKKIGEVYGVHHSTISRVLCNNQ